MFNMFGVLYHVLRWSYEVIGLTKLSKLSKAAIHPPSHLKKLVEGQVTCDVQTLISSGRPSFLLGHSQLDRDSRG